MLELEKFISDCSDLLTKNDSNYKKYCANINDYLESTINNNKIIIQSRVKNIKSLREKIYRKNYYDKFVHEPKKLMNELSDVIGVRIICLLNTDENYIFNKLKDCYQFTCTIKGNKYSSIESNYDTNSFLAIQFSGQPQKQHNDMEIYRLDSIWYDKTNNEYINVELQIKSLVHFFWDELDHMLFYKNYACLIGNEFNKEVMKHVHTNLETIDSQLLTIRQHIEDENNEIKDFAKFMIYSKYNDAMNDIWKIENDLREVYEVIVDVFFGNISIYYNKRLSDLLVKLEKTNKIELDNNLLKEGLNLSFIKEELKELASVIDSLIKSMDVFWISLYIAYKDINNFSTYTEVISDISEKCINVLTAKIDSDFEFSPDDYDEDINLERKVELFRNSIISSIGVSLSIYKKIDFFIYHIHYNNICDVLCQFSRSRNYYLKDMTINELENEFETLNLYLRCLLLGVISDKIPSEWVIELIGRVNKQDPFNLYNNSNDIKINENECNLSDFNDIFNLVGEDE